MKTIWSNELIVVDGLAGAHVDVHITEERCTEPPEDRTTCAKPVSRPIISYTMRHRRENKYFQGKRWCCGRTLVEGDKQESRQIRYRSFSGWCDLPSFWRVPCTPMRPDTRPIYQPATRLVISGGTFPVSQSFPGPVGDIALV